MSSGSTALPGLKHPGSTTGRRNSHAASTAAGDSDSNLSKADAVLHSPIKVKRQQPQPQPQPQAQAETLAPVVSPIRTNRHAPSASMGGSSSTISMAAVNLVDRHPSGGHHRRVSAPPLDAHRPGSQEAVTNPNGNDDDEQAANSRKVEEIRKTLEKSFESATKQQELAAAMKKKKLLERLQRRRLRSSHGSRRPFSSPLAQQLVEGKQQMQGRQQMQMQRLQAPEDYIDHFPGPRPTSSPSNANGGGAHVNIFADAARDLRKRTGADTCDYSTNDDGNREDGAGRVDGSQGGSVGGNSGSAAAARPNTTSGPVSDASSSPWVMYYDEFSNPYYYNNDTGMSQWERPAGFKAAKSGLSSFTAGTGESDTQYQYHAGDAQYQGYANGSAGYSEEYGTQYYGNEGEYNYSQGDYAQQTSTDRAAKEAEEQRVKVLKKKMELKLKKEERQMKKKVIALNRQLKTQSSTQDAILSEMQLELESEIQTGLMQQQQMLALQQQLEEAQREKERHAQEALQAKRELERQRLEAEQRAVSSHARDQMDDLARPYSPAAVARRFAAGDLADYASGDDASDTGASGASSPLGSSRLAASPIAADRAARLHRRERARSGLEGKTGGVELESKQQRQMAKDEMRKRQEEWESRHAEAQRAAAAMSARPASRGGNGRNLVSASGRNGVETENRLRQRSKRRERRRATAIKAEDMGLSSRANDRVHESKQRQNDSPGKSQKSMKQDQKHGSKPKKKKNDFFAALADFFAPTKDLVASSDSDSETDSSSNDHTDDSSSTGDGSGREAEGIHAQTTAVVARTSTHGRGAAGQMASVFQTKAASGSGVSMETQSTELASMNTLVLDWTSRKLSEQRQRQRSSSSSSPVRARRLSNRSASMERDDAAENRSHSGGDEGDQRPGTSGFRW